MDKIIIRQRMASVLMQTLPPTDIKLALDKLEALFESALLEACELGRNKWVSVEERLPKKVQQVLTCTDEGYIRFMTYGVMPSGFPSEVTYWQEITPPQRLCTLKTYNG